MALSAGDLDGDLQVDYDGEGSIPMAVKFQDDVPVVVLIMIDSFLNRVSRLEGPALGERTAYRAIEDREGWKRM